MGWVCSLGAVEVALAGGDGGLAGGDGVGFFARWFDGVGRNRESFGKLVESGTVHFGDGTVEAWWVGGFVDADVGLDAISGAGAEALLIGFNRATLDDATRRAAVCREDEVATALAGAAVRGGCARAVAAVFVVARGAIATAQRFAGCFEAASRGE